MIITEQRIKEIITEELLLEISIQDVSKKLKDIFSIKTKNKQPEIEQIDVNDFIKDIPSEKKEDDIKTFFDYINKLHSDVNDLKTVRDRLQPNSKDYSEAEKIISTMQNKIALLMQQWNEPIRQELEAEINKAHEEAIKINRKTRKDKEKEEKKAASEIEKSMKPISASVPPPPPKKSKFDYSADDSLTKIAEKIGKDPKRVADLINLLKSKGMLNPETIKKLGLTESLIRQVFNKFEGNKNMKLTEKLVKQLIKEEINKVRTNEAFEGISGAFQGLKSGAKSAMSGEMSGGKTGKFPNLAKKYVSDIATKTAELSTQITKLKLDAEKSNLAVSKELSNVINKLAGVRDASVDANKPDKQLLFPKGSPEAAPEQSSTATPDKQPTAGGETTGGTGGASATQTPDGRTTKAFGRQFSGTGPEGGLDGAAATDASTQATGPSGEADKQQTRKDKASQAAQSANKNQTQSPEVKNLQSIINSVRNPAKNTNTIMASKPILARLGAAGFTPQQSKKVVELFKTFLTDKVKKTSKGSQITITEEEQAQTGHNNLRVFDNSNRSVMGNLITIMKQVLKDESLGKPTKEISDTIVANLAKELAKDIANQARLSAGLTIDAKGSTAQPPAGATGTTGTPPAPAPAPAPAAQQQPAEQSAEQSAAQQQPAEQSAEQSAAQQQPAEQSAEQSAAQQQPAEQSAEQSAANTESAIKKFSDFTKNNPGKSTKEFLKQFDSELQQSGLNANKANNILQNIANELKIDVKDLLAEKKLNETLISRNKNNNKSLSNDQIARMKLLAGITK